MCGIVDAANFFSFHSKTVTVYIISMYKVCITLMDDNINKRISSLLLTQTSMIYDYENQRQKKKIVKNRAIHTYLIVVSIKTNKQHNITNSCTLCVFSFSCSCHITSIFHLSKLICVMVIWLLDLFVSIYNVNLCVLVR